MTIDKMNLRALKKLRKELKAKRALPGFRKHFQNVQAAIKSKREAVHEIIEAHAVKRFCKQLENLKLKKETT